MEIKKMPTPEEIAEFFKKQTYFDKFCKKEIECPLYVEYIEVYKPLPNVMRVYVNGDWKHDHGYCDYLMEQLGFQKIGEEQLAPSDCDSYYSVHNYLFTGKTKK